MCIRDRLKIMAQNYVVMARKNLLKPSEAPKYYAVARSGRKVTAIQMIGCSQRLRLGIEYDASLRAVVPHLDLHTAVAGSGDVYKRQAMDMVRPKVKAKTSNFEINMKKTLKKDDLFCIFIAYKPSIKIQ